MRGVTALWMVAIAAGVAVAGCAKGEPRVVTSSFDAQFEALGKDGWQVTRTNQPAGQAAGRGRANDPLSDPNVRVIRGANFNNLQFKTNFQVDAPPGQKPATQPAEPAPAGPALPWGIGPSTPAPAPGGGR